jgi:hypothetical protein
MQQLVYKSEVCHSGRKVSGVPPAPLAEAGNLDSCYRIIWCCFGGLVVWWHISISGEGIEGGLESEFHYRLLISKRINSEFPSSPRATPNP